MVSQVNSDWVNTEPDVVPPSISPTRPKESIDAKRWRSPLVAGVSALRASGLEV